MSINDRRMENTLKGIRRSVGKRVVENLQQFMDDNDKNFRYFARSSFVYNDIMRRVESDVPWVETIDLGQPPGYEPDFDALWDWVEHSGKIDHGGDPIEIVDITNKIFRSIKRKGIFPTRMTLKVLTDMERESK